MTQDEKMELRRDISSLIIDEIMYGVDPDLLKKTIDLSIEIVDLAKEKEGD